MSWSNGTNIVIKLIKLIKKHVKEDVKRADIYIGLFDIFINADWDNINEVKGIDPVADMIINKINKEINDELC